MSTLIEDVWIDGSQLSFEQTVPRSLVHKQSLENVLLTEVRNCGDDRFVCAGRIPTAHRFFNGAGRTPRTDILFYTELGRQASIAISHAFLGVSREEIFIFEQSQAAMKADSRPFQSRAGSVVTEIRVLETERRRNNSVGRIVAEQTMSIGGERVFQGTGAWTLQPPALFQRLRRMSKIRSSVPGDIAIPDAAAPADLLRRNDGGDVVISAPKYDADAQAFVSSLIVDETHPYFFDHACDHVPGMLLLEGCSQLALAAAAATAPSAPSQLTISNCGVNFSQFVESSIPVTLTARVNAAEVDGDGSSIVVRISISQQSVISGTTTMSVAFPD